jgi:hypothetical protein
MCTFCRAVGTSGAFDSSVVGGGGNDDGWVLFSWLGAERNCLARVSRLVVLGRGQRRRSPEKLLSCMFLD